LFELFFLCEKDKRLFTQDFDQELPGHLERRKRDDRRVESSIFQFAEQRFRWARFNFQSQLRSFLCELTNRAEQNPGESNSVS
jgi:hypothetical protein